MAIAPKFNNLLIYYLIVRNTIKVDVTRLRCYNLPLSFLFCLNTINFVNDEFKKGAFQLTKEEYIEAIVKLMQQTDDDVMIDFIYQLLIKAG